MATLYIGSRIYRLLHGAELDLAERRSGGATLAFEDLEQALAFLRRAAAGDPSNLAALRRVTAEALARYRLDEHEDAAVLRLLARALVTGRVRVAASARSVLGTFGEIEEADEARPEPFPARRAAPSEPPPSRTWIEIELLGDDGRPVVEERYRIKLTDGSIRVGRLDNRGRARFDELDPGVCVVWFPDLSGEVWGTAEAAADEPADEAAAQKEWRGKTWVEIELLGEDDEPIPGERYELRLPSGRVETGRLDEFGSAFHDNIDPGTCSVSFPDLAPGCWEPA